MTSKIASVLPTLVGTVRTNRNGQSQLRSILNHKKVKLAVAEVHCWFWITKKLKSYRGKYFDMHYAHFHKNHFFGWYEWFPILEGFSAVYTVRDLFCRRKFFSIYFFSVEVSLINFTSNLFFFKLTFNRGR